MSELRVDGCRDSGTTSKRDKEVSSSSDRVLAPLQALSAQWKELASKLYVNDAIYETRRIQLLECASELDTVVARLRSQQEENKEDDPRVAPLTAGDDGQDLPRRGSGEK